MCAEHRDEERDEWRRLRRIRELDEESNQLAREQAIYESTKSKHNTDSEQVRKSPHYDSKDSLGRDRAMRSREHYREWLGSQNIIDSIRNAEIEENGLMDIPPRNKRPGYSGYPLTAELVILGWVLRQKTPAQHKIRLATPVALRLIVFPGRC